MARTWVGSRQLPKQERLGDFWLPQVGIFFVGRAIFTPALADATALA